MQDSFGVTRVHHAALGFLMIDSVQAGETEGLYNARGRFVCLACIDTHARMPYKHARASRMHNCGRPTV